MTQTSDLDKRFPFFCYICYTNTQRNWIMNNNENLEGKRGSVSEYLDKIGEYALLSAEEEQELLPQAANGNEEALDKILNANLRFIVSIANQYQNRRLSLLQLFDISKQGLANAVKECASKPHNQRFIKFAVPYMRKAIEEAITANNK